jgi:hypothetical protein
MAGALRDRGFSERTADVLLQLMRCDGEDDSSSASCADCRSIISRFVTKCNVIRDNTQSHYGENGPSLLHVREGPPHGLRSRSFARTRKRRDNGTEHIQS